MNKRTISIIPPEIVQHFSHLLLSSPGPLLRDCCDTIQKMLTEIEKLWHKLDSNLIRKERCENLKKEILGLYERAKVKEKERETEKDHKTQGFGYSFVGYKKNDRDIYWRLKFGRKEGAFL